jgi:hypothetical protein
VTPGCQLASHGFATHIGSLFTSSDPVSITGSEENGRL